MDNNDRKVMEEELLALGLHQSLLNSLSDDIIRRLFEMIGWASPAFKEDENG
tara:strand:+ start:176 stop:331 length:156 start_codon:yes stop_codon:yes gene_type:complete